MSALAAGLIADGISPAVGVWSMVALVAIAGSAWAVFASPLLGRTTEVGRDR